MQLIEMSKRIKWRKRGVRNRETEIPDAMRKPDPKKPTNALPGTRAKVLEMARRAEQGEGLFHPQDRRRIL